jgi:hypothetical protein
LRVDLINVGNIPPLANQYAFDFYEACKFVNKLYKNDAFYNEIAKVPHYDYSRHGISGRMMTGFEVSSTIMEFVENELNINIIDIAFERGGMFSNGWNALVSPNRPTTIVINSRKRRSYEAMCNTLAHEIVHVIDNLDPYGHYLGHGKNAVRLTSAPYKIGTIAEMFTRNIDQVDTRPKKKLICKGWWIFKKCYYEES